MSDKFEVETPILEQREPVRAPSIHSDVLVPFYRALAYGIGVGLLGVLIALALDWQLETRSWALLFAIPALIVVLAVLATQFGWAQSTLWKIEEYTRQDLTQDGRIGEPPVFTSVNQYGRVTKHELTPEREKTRFLEFVRACYEGNTSVTTLTRRGFSESDIDRYRAILMRPDVGAARWRNDRSHQLGWKMVKPESEVIAVAERGLWRKNGALPKPK